ncbi:MAG: 2-isopropylmalate synthase [Alphaproteobacteria bacterium]|nr:2-isopropylmalate synthase [Alphaproteobacteria bacterium]
MSDDYVRIFDTTLRDGEQSPGATMTPDEKLRLARKLDGMGVDVIEAGFPAASPGELRSVARVAELCERAEVAALCRTREGDIKAAWEGVKGARRPRLHVFIATSDIHLEHKLRMTREQVLAEIERGVSLCRSLCDVVEFSAEDATRSDLGFLCEAFATAVRCGASVVNVPDTVGYTMPHEYDRIIRAVCETVGPEVIVSTHCHNDLGLAVANSLAAIRAGARQIEGCINGIGERAGNASIEEVVMALRTRRELMGIETRIDTTQLLSASRMVRDVTGLTVQPNKAIVGRNAFAHEAGIHQHGVLANTLTYEIMRPEDVGWNDSNLVLGKHSGKHALQARLEELGFRLDKEELARVFDRFKRLCDRKKVIYDEDLLSIVSGGEDRERRYQLGDVMFQSGTSVLPTATVVVHVDGAPKRAASTGDGPVAALLEAIKQATGTRDVVLEDYHLDAVTGGTDAQGKVHVRIRVDDVVAHGQGTHTDVVVASGEAFVDALDQLAFLQARLAEVGQVGDPEVAAASHGV